MRKHVQKRQKRQAEDEGEEGEGGLGRQKQECRNCGQEERDQEDQEDRDRKKREGQEDQEQHQDDRDEQEEPEAERDPRRVNTNQTLRLCRDLFAESETGSAPTTLASAPSRSNCEKSETVELSLCTIVSESPLISMYSEVCWQCQLRPPPGTQSQHTPLTQDTQARMSIWGFGEERTCRTCASRRRPAAPAPPRRCRTPPCCRTPRSRCSPSRRRWPP